MNLMTFAYVTPKQVYHYSIPNRCILYTIPIYTSVIITHVIYQYRYHHVNIQPKDFSCFTDNGLALEKLHQSKKANFSDANYFPICSY